MSVLIYIIIFFAAPLISRFYSQPILINLTRILSLVFIINSFSFVQEARLNKMMQFRTITVISLPSTFIGGLTGIIMACMNYGVWSLIALQLVTRFCFACQIWYYSKWIPLSSFSGVKVKQLFSFGRNLMLSQLIATVFRNIYYVVIGKYFTLESLGYYQNANTLVRLPSESIATAMDKVSFSAFSSISR